MLYIDFGETKHKAPGYVSDVYHADYRDSWMDDFAKSIILEIEGSVVENPHAIVHPYFGVHNCYEVCSGVKNILLAKNTNHVIDGDCMGDNCWPALLRITKEKDVIVTLKHVPKVPKDIEAVIMNDNSVVSNDQEFYDRATSIPWWES